jgi:hypothetical protein
VPNERACQRLLGREMLSQQQCLVHRSSSRWPSARHPSGRLQEVFQTARLRWSFQISVRPPCSAISCPNPWLWSHLPTSKMLPELPLERIRLAGIRLCGDSVVKDMTAGVCIRCLIEGLCVISSATCTRGLCGDTSGECQNGFIGFLSRCQRHARCMCCRMGPSGGRTH